MLKNFDTGSLIPFVTMKGFVTGILSLGFILATDWSAAYEKDTAQSVLEQQNATTWQREDQLIDRRLAALRG